MSNLDYVNLIRGTVEKIADKYDKMSISQVLFSTEKIRLPKWSSDRNIAEGYREPANREFLKLNAKHVIDSECVVDGVLLVSPYCVTFRPAVVQLVENGPNKCSTVAFSDVILSVALYKQLPNLNKDKDEDCYGCGKNAQHSHGEIYRGESIDSKTSTQMPIACGDTIPPSYCLCLKVLSSEACRAKEFVNCNSLKKLPDGEFDDKSKGEFWFSIPLSEVDILYKFFVQWMPKKYANFEASQIFSEVQAPNVHANPKILTHSETFTTSSDNLLTLVEVLNNILPSLPNCFKEIGLLCDKKLNTMKLEPDEMEKEQKRLLAKIYEMMKGGKSYNVEEMVNNFCPNEKIDTGNKMVDSRNKVLSEGIREMMKHIDCSKNRCSLPGLFENDPVQEAKEKRDLMRERKNKKISKQGGVVKAEDVAGFRGQKSIDNILAFIEGGSSKMKNNLKKEKNNSTKKNDIKRHCDSNFNDKSVKKTENKSEVSVDGGEISKTINFLLFSNDVSALENSDKPENDECSADFVSCSRRLLKNILVARSTSVKEAKPVIKSKNYKIPTASSARFENSKEKSEKRKQKLKINPYTWPFVLLKPENLKIDESESGKSVTRQNVNVSNSSDGSFSEISNSSSSNEFSSLSKFRACCGKK